MRVHHMNTVKLKVPYDRIQEIRKDLRRLRTRYYPFRRQADGMEIEIFNCSAISYFLLKYG